MGQHGWVAWVPTQKAADTQKPHESFIRSVCTKMNATCPEPQMVTIVHCNEDGHLGNIPAPLQSERTMLANIIHPPSDVLRKYTMIPFLHMSYVVRREM